MNKPLDAICLETSDNPEKKTRRSYTIQTKPSTLAKLGEFGENKSKTANVCGVPRQCLQEWVKEKEKLQEARTERQIAVRKRRHVKSSQDVSEKRGKFSELERRLVSWIKERRESPKTFSPASLQIWMKLPFGSTSQVPALTISGESNVFQTRLQEKKS